VLTRHWRVSTQSCKLILLSVSDCNKNVEKIKIINLDAIELNVSESDVNISIIHYPMTDSYNYCRCRFHGRINFVKDEIDNHAGKVIIVTNNYVNIASASFATSSASRGTSRENMLSQTAILLGYCLKKDIDNQSDRITLPCSTLSPSSIPLSGLFIRRKRPLSGIEPATSGQLDMEK